MSPETPAGFVTISELARLRGVSIPAISKRVTRLEAASVLRTQPGPRGAKLVNVADFNRVAAQTVDAVRSLNGASGGSPSPAADPTPGAPILAKEQARRTKADADLKELDRDERIGQLVRGDKIKEAIVDALRMHTKVLSQLVSRAEENAAAVRKDGVPGARAFLKRLETELREDIADRALELARSKAENDE
jgi:DNA-binding MarR family transcriptional regulator